MRRKRSRLTRPTSPVGEVSGAPSPFVITGLDLMIPIGEATLRHSGAAKQSPEPMATGGSEKGGTVPLHPDTMVFMGSGLFAARSPGMTEGGALRTGMAGSSPAITRKRS